VIYEELKLADGIIDNQKQGISQGKSYVIIDVKDCKYLIKNNEGVLTWHDKENFSKENEWKILVPIRNVVYLDETRKGVIQGSSYSVFKQKTDSYNIFDENYDFEWYNIKKFKAAEEFVPQDIEVYTKSQSVMKVQKPKYKKVPNIVKANRDLAAVAIAGVIFNWINIYTVAIFGGIFLFKNAQMIQQYLSAKSYNKKLEKESQVELQKARIITAMPPDILARLTTMDHKIKSISKDVIVGNDFMNSMIGYIMNWVVIAENQGGLPSSTIRLIHNYLDSCDRYIDEQYSVVSSDKALIGSELEKIANLEIEKQTRVIDSATKDLKFLKMNRTD
jgi:hypothetical protein